MENKNILTTATVGLSALALGMYIGSKRKSNIPTQLVKQKTVSSTTSKAKFKLALC